MNFKRLASFLIKRQGLLLAEIISDELSLGSEGFDKAAKNLHVVSLKGIYQCVGKLLDSGFKEQVVELKDDPIVEP